MVTTINFMFCILMGILSIYAVVNLVHSCSHCQAVFDSVIVKIYKNNLLKFIKNAYVVGHEMLLSPDE